MELFVISIFGAVLGGVLASRKNRSVVGWVLLGLVIPVSALFLFALKPLPDADTPAADATDTATN
jgi:uncharacterized membrane protein YfcA